MKTSSSDRSAKPDYQSPSFRGALMNDHWALAQCSEYSTVPSSLIADLNRASLAITTISRLVHNSLSEPDMSSAEPLGAPAHLGLLCAIEIVGEYLERVADEMRGTAAIFSKSDAQEVDRD